MATERETKELKTSRGHTIVYKAYCTGREFNEIEQVYLTGAKVNMIGKEVHVDSFSPTIQQDADKKAIETLVVSLDGQAASVVDRVLDLPHDEYLEVVDALGVVSGKKKVTEQ